MTHQFPGLPTSRIAVLVSGAGSNLAALLARRDLGGRIVLVAADRRGTGGVALAREAGVEVAEVPLERGADRTAWEARLAERVAAAGTDLVVLAGFMRILSAGFVQRWPTLNVHPSLLPAFPGASAVRDALDHGVKVTGATVHLVDELVDHGPIISQEALDVLGDDDVDSLHSRIKQIEHRLLGEAVADWCHGRIEVDGRRTRRTQ